MGFCDTADWKSAAYVILVFVLLCGSALLTSADGVLPTDKNGRALNFDFEDGTLRDWIARAMRS